MKTDTRTVSIVIPLHNEAEVLDKTLTTLTRELSKMPHHFEVILVDDGSTDATWHTITQPRNAPFQLCGIRFSRNFGKECAIMAGLRHATGDAAIVMDGDLQHPPEIIAKLIARWVDTHCAVVHARKAGRVNESDQHTIFVDLFYRIYRLTTNVDITHASDFKLLDRRMITAYTALPERELFFRGLVPWLGHTQETITFQPARRPCGTSKWGMVRRASLAIHALTSFSTLPLQMVTLAGVLFLCGATVLGAQTLYVWMSGQAIEGFTTLILLVLLVGSILMISLGIIGQYLAHIYREIKQRPSYVVQDLYQATHTP